MKKAVAVILAALFLSATPMTTPAEEFVQWSKNGHYYKAVHIPEGISWTEAKAQAEEAGGYLATITSSQENTFVSKLIDDERFWGWHDIYSHFGPWIGGYQADGAREPDGGWTWVTGEEVGYSRWASREPYGTFLGMNENRIQFYSLTAERAADWNDAVDFYPEHAVRGYVIEKEKFIQWPGTGHYYKAFSVPEGISWTQAQALAEQAGGYLATITSPQENAFVFDLIDDERYWGWYDDEAHAGPWIGGYQDADGREPDGGWKWVTGEEFDYQKWAPKEPYGTFLEMNEDRLQYYSRSAERTAKWNDAVDFYQKYNVRGYVVEKNDP